ncbi:MAG TPA: serine/threonine-protein kinase [Nocardioidaceae bacterium]|nr:serine/threonine-protein kinase [Nocardioidaceae bacterium]
MIAERYTLLREIGRGGMGAVWLARDEVLGREVALKRVGHFPGGSTPDLVRAEREAKLAAKLNHPHVVAVFDFVSDGDAQWLVMEYVDGATLADLAKKRRGLAPEQAAPLIRQAAEALAAAHKAGIVHRDVKPSNILVKPDGTAKLADFGIARARADSTLTQTGLVTGSPAYLAPEVASGRSATDASDVWSLGATLYQALTGRPPYDVGDNVMGALYKIVHEEPPRLSTAGWLAPLLEATMATDPKQRWSMAQVRDFLEGSATATVPVAPPARRTPEPTKVIAPNPMARPPASRRSPLPWIAALAAVLVIGGVGWLLLTGNDDGTPGGNGTPTSTSTKTTEPDPSETGPTPTSTDMVAFVQTYLSTVTEDPDAAFEFLTPAFQEESGGIQEYKKFWNPIRSATPSNIRADPGALSVSYRVEYDGPKNRPSEGNVVLELVFDGEQYLIAGES